MRITEFVLARIAEDEAVAQSAAEEGQLFSPLDYNFECGILIASARVLAEVEAKRRIVEGALYEMGPSTTEDWLLPLLALPYADHPDYLDEWRPDTA